MITGRMPASGLCSASLLGYIDENLLDLMEPTLADNEQLEAEGLETIYWASGLKESDPNVDYAFTQLRQTIVLFMAAMNNEL